MRTDSIQMPKRTECIFTILTIFFILTAFEVSAQWGYTIGQKEIPEVIIQENIDEFKVYPGHPRLFFRDTDIPVLQKRINGDFKQEWLEMVADLESRVLSKPAANFAEGKYLKGWDSGRNVTFLAVVTGNEKYINWAKQWAEALAAAGPVGIDDQYRGRLQSMAVAYDWLYSWLSDAEKKQLRRAIIEHIDKNWYFATGADYVGGHSRWGNFALAAGLLSVVTEQPDMWQKLLVVREHWVNGYYPLQGWIAVDGGYHMGWSYSAAYLTGDPHCVWSAATNECVYYPWQGLLPLFWIYGRQGDGLYPNTGDAYTIERDLNVQRELLMTAAGIFKNPYAAWSIQPTSNRFADILYGDKNVKSFAPGNSYNPLSLSRHFRNAGVVIARDKWDENTTHLQFRSVPFYSANHHHRDENSFTLHYKAPLAIDAGLYDEGGPEGGYGSSHWRNYFTRTVAHNGIVVFDPEQQMTVYGTPKSNDGGQTYRTEPTRFMDILPGGHAHLDGIIHYEDTEEFTYAVGDASKAYDPDHVKLAQREIIFLRKTSLPHPVVIVFDRVESTKPDFEKRFLLHTVNEPVISGKMTVTENKGGRLTCLTVLPEEANLKLVGGAGKEFLVDGVNYPIDSEARVRPGLEPGAWRLEVSPVKHQLTDYFLHVLFVDDDDATPVNPDLVKVIKDENSVEIHLAGRMVLFPFNETGKAVVK
jgi:hypothetical protein